MRVLTWTRADVDEGLLEQTEPELRGEHPGDGRVDERHLHVAALDRRSERLAVAVGARQLDVDAGPQRERGRVLDRRDDVVVVGELADAK